MLACVSVIASFEPKCKMHRRYCLHAIKATLVSVTLRTAVTSKNLRGQLKIVCLILGKKHYQHGYRNFEAIEIRKT